MKELELIVAIGCVGMAWLCLVILKMQKRIDKIEDTYCSEDYVNMLVGDMNAKVAKPKKATPAKKKSAKKKTRGL